MGWSMFEVIRWASIIMCWIATGMNIYAMIRLNRCRKWYEKKNNELEAESKYYNTMIAACTEFLEATHGESEVTEEDIDGLA